jgi:hypothetical protein
MGSQDGLSDSETHQSLPSGEADGGFAALNPPYGSPNTATNAEGW